MLKLWLSAGAVSAIVCLVGCGGGSTSSPPTSGATSAPAGTSAPAVGVAGANLGTATVKIAATGQLSFVPAMQTAHVGDIIQWTNTGSVEHTITFDAQPSLSDPSLQPGGQWEVKFTTAGTYQYRCSIHANMLGTIVVS
jgi:plastocyanin